MDTVYTLNTEADTAALAKALADTFKGGDILLLEGNLGAGKSTFARHLIWALGCTEKHIPSPTYTITQAYEDTRVPVLHTDAYRLTSEDDFTALDVQPLRPTHLFLVEWGDHIGWTPSMTNPYGKVYQLRLEHEGGVRTATFS